MPGGPPWCRNLPESFAKADDGSRTRYLELGKLALYQVSYVRVLAHSRFRARLSTLCAR